MNNENEVLDLALPMIKKFEGFRSHAYQDSVGVWTVGYGTTRNVTPHTVVTEEEADHLLRDAASDAYRCVRKAVKVELTAHQAAALVSFVYNLGCGAFKGSTLLKLINAKDFTGASHEFGRWVHAGHVTLSGLVARRAEEATVFMA